MQDETRLALDARNTRITFTAMLGPVPVRGHFRDFHGEFVVPDGNVERASLTMDVDAGSVTTGMKMRDRHLLGRSFLDAEHAPRVSFRSHRVSREPGALVIDGTLSLRGIERPVTSRCPLTWHDGEGVAGSLSLGGEIVVDCPAFGVGRPIGLDVLNPIFLVVRPEVVVRVELVVAARQLLPALLPALGR